MSLKKYAVGLAAVVALIALSSTPAFAIANGEDAAEGAYPFNAVLSAPAIVRPDGTTYASACSGALVAPKWIITAGHCAHDGARNRISGAPRYPINATVGQDTLSGGGGTTVAVVKVVQNPNSDVALLELAAPVDAVAPLRISDDVPVQGDAVRLVGWGSADGIDELSHRPDHLQTGEYVVTRVLPNELYIEGTGPDLLTSACGYDSGAPFFTEGAGGPRLVATEISGPTCPHSSEELTARADVLGSWVALTVGS